MSYSRVKYTGSTPGADANTYVLFSSYVMYPAPYMLQGGGVKTVALSLEHDHDGTLNTYSSDDGITWLQVSTEAITAPSASGTTYKEYKVATYPHFKIEWVNASSAQTTWNVGVALIDER
jgi:hypothetical protein